MGPRTFLESGVVCRTTSASRPTPASWTKYSWLACGRSTNREEPASITCQALVEIVLRNTQFRGEHIHCADREDAKLNGCAPDAIDHFIDRSVTAGGNDRAISLAHRAGSEFSRIAGGTGASDEHMVRQRCNLVAQRLGAFTPSGRIQNDKDFVLLVHASHSGKVS